MSNITERELEALNETLARRDKRIEELREYARYLEKKCKRAGIPFTKQQKRRTVHAVRGGLGLVSGAEILAGLVIRGRI